jgi:hypothetical protein
MTSDSSFNASSSSSSSSNPLNFEQLDEKEEKEQPISFIPKARQYLGRSAEQILVESDNDDEIVRVSEENRTEESNDSEKKESDLNKTALLVHTLSSLIFITGMVTTVFLPPVGIGIMTLGAVGLSTGIGMSELTGPQGQKAASSQFMNRSSGGCDSYDQMLGKITTERGDEYPATTLADELKKNGLEASKTLRDLDDAYKALESKFADGKMPKKAPDGWKITGATLQQKEQAIKALKLSEEQKSDLENHGFSEEDIKNYETYFKNFLLLKAAQHDGATHKFFKQPGT